MHCPDCGAPMRVTNDGAEATCYTCDSCPAHYFWTEHLTEQGGALVLPLAGADCPGCGLLIPYEKAAFDATFS